MHTQSISLRPGTRNDAVTVAALSLQVFLDTYATDGVRPDLAREAPVPGLRGVELVRLYVQPQAQRSGVGTTLLREAEKIAASAKAHALWLTVWERNDRALAFYARCGYADVGSTVYTFEGREYGNRVVAKQLSAA